MGKKPARAQVLKLAAAYTVEELEIRRLLSGTQRIVGEMVEGAVMHGTFIVGGYSTGEASTGKGAEDDASTPAIMASQSNDDSSDPDTTSHLISWEPAVVIPDGDIEYDPTGIYVIELSDGQEIDGITDTSYRADGLTPGTEYSYTIAAQYYIEDSGGGGGSSGSSFGRVAPGGGAERWVTMEQATDMVARPNDLQADDDVYFDLTDGDFTTDPLEIDGPSDIGVADVTSNSATISWDAADDNAYDIAGYEIQYRADSSSEWISAPSTSDTSIELNDLQSGQGYSVQVRAFDSDDNYGGWMSATDLFTTPQALTDPGSPVASSISADSATVSWEGATDSEGATINYALQYSVSGSGTWIDAEPDPTTDTSISLKGLDPSTTYDLQVEASSDGYTDPDGYIAGAPFETSPDQVSDPGAPIASAIGADEATINWSPATDAAGKAINYTLEFQKSGSGQWVDEGPTSNTSVVLTSLVPDTPYDLQVEATNADGLNDPDDFITGVGFTTLQDTVTDPGPPSATNITANSATVSWSSSTDAAGETIEYTFAYQQSGSSDWTDEDPTPNTSLQLSDLEPNTAYALEVEAANSGGITDSSGFITGATFTTLPDNVTNPGPPTASNVTSNGATIAWTPSSDASGEYITYTLEYEEQGADTWLEAPQTTNTSEILGGLQPSTTYDLQVEAENADGLANPGGFVAGTPFTTNTHIIQAVSSSDGDMRFLTGSELPQVDNTYVAVIEGIPTDVKFDLGGETIDGTDGDNGWTATFNMSALDATQSTLIVRAFQGTDLVDTYQEAVQLTPLPMWMSTPNVQLSNIEFDPTTGYTFQVSDWDLNYSFSTPSNWQWTPSPLFSTPLVDLSNLKTQADSGWQFTMVAAPDGTVTASNDSYHVDLTVLNQPLVDYSFPLGISDSFANPDGSISGSTNVSFAPLFDNSLEFAAGASASESMNLTISNEITLFSSSVSFYSVPFIASLAKIQVAVTASVTVSLDANDTEDISPDSVQMASFKFAPSISVALKATDTASIGNILGASLASATVSLTGTVTQNFTAAWANDAMTFDAPGMVSLSGSLAWSAVFDSWAGGADLFSWKINSWDFVADSGASPVTNEGSYGVPSDPGAPVADLITSSSATISWNSSIDPSGNAITYVLAYETSASSTWTLVNTEAPGMELSGLESSTIYNLAVLAMDSDGSTSNWSQGWFQTSSNLSAPVQTSPTNGSSNQPAEPSLSWDPVTGAVGGYRVIVDTTSADLPTDPSNGTDGTAVVNESTKSTAITPPLALAPGTTYFWEVQAIDSSANGGPWSNIEGFTTAAELMAPTETAPANGATKQSTLPTFTWTAVTGAVEGYNLIVDTILADLPTDPGGTAGPTGLPDHTTENADTLSTSLLPGTTYYWEVQAVGAGGAPGPWSLMGSFVTAATLTPPVLTAPSMGSTSAPDVPTFTWNAVTGATEGYNIIVDTSSSDLPSSLGGTAGATAVWNDHTSGTADTPAAQLSPGTTYYWEVQGIDGSGNPGPWSQVSNFTTLPPLVAPVLEAPASGSLQSRGSATFTWTMVTGAGGGYNIAVATTSSDLPEEPNDTVGPTGVLTHTTGPSYAPTNLLFGTQYFWEVQAVDSNGNKGPWSQVASFTTTSPLVTVTGDGEPITSGESDPDYDDGTAFPEALQGGAPVQETFTIQNSGTDTLTLGTVAVPPGFKVVTQPQSSITSGASTTFTIQLVTNAVGSPNGFVSFSDNDPTPGNNPFTFAIIGTVSPKPAPMLAVSGNGDFGSVLMNSAAPQHVFTIENVGIAPLVVGTVVVPPGFVVVGQPSSPIAAGGSTTIVVGLNTGSAGTFSGNLNFQDNDTRPGENPFILPLSGMVVATPTALISLTGNGHAISVDESTPSSANDTSFGSATQNAGAVRETYTIDNTGTGTLTLGSLTVPAGFIVVSQPPASIAAGGSATFTIGMATAIVGTFGGNVSLSNNDPASGENPFTFAISGTVIAQPTPVMTVLGDGQTIAPGENSPTIQDGTSFGTALENSAEIPETFTIQNGGDAPLTIGSVVVLLGFSIISAPTTVAAGFDGALEIEMNTGTVGVFGGNVSFADNDTRPGEDSFVFAISGAVSAAPTIPTIVFQPTNQSGVSGSIATFIATATATPIPTEQWQVSTDGGNSYNNIQGATGSFYSMAIAPSDYGDEFRAIFTNSAGSTDTNSAALGRAVPAIAVSDSGGFYDDAAFPATAIVTGVNGLEGSSLEGVSPNFSYYAGTSTAGPSSSTAPINPGTYTVVATFPGSSDYALASSAPVSFTITAGQLTYTLSTLSSFSTSGGYWPSTGVVIDGYGNLFGTTDHGGANNTGTIFEVASGSNLATTLASFASGLGSPSGLILDSEGDLFGLAEDGSSVFELPYGSNSISTLASMDGPYAQALAIDANGDLFGTVFTGSIIYNPLTVSSSDTISYAVFEIPHGTNEVDIVSNYPSGTSLTGIAVDPEGDVFGGTSSGSVFEIAHGSNIVTTIASLSDTDGATPSALGELVLDSAGNIFGAISPVGSFDGGIFEIAAGSGTITTLAAFSPDTGFEPGGLIMNSEGDLFGAAEGGGANGTGTVFELLAQSGTITPLVSFPSFGSSVENASTAALAEDSRGDLFGTFGLQGGANNDGAVFEVSPAPQIGVGLASSNASSPTDQPVTFTATLMPDIGVVATGTIEFLIDGSNVSGPIAVNDNVAIYTTSALGAGSHSVTAVYSGDEDFGRSASNPLTQNITAVPGPTVNGISPASGPPSGGTTVTIVGTGFSGVTAVYFGATPVSSFTINSNGTQITVISPAGTVGTTVDVTVVTAAGASATSAADQFTILPAWLAVGSQATWNALTNTLTVTGSATIIADPGSAEPNIVASGSGAVLTIAPVTSPSDIHIGGLTLTNGASIVMSDVDTAQVAKGTNAANHRIDHNVLVIGMLGAVNDPTISIDSSSKLDLGDNDLIVHTGSSDNGNGTPDQELGVVLTNELKAIEALVATARNVAPGGIYNGTWTGNGITSSAAAISDDATNADYEQNILAVAQNSDMYLGGYSTWRVGNASETLGSKDIIVKYTYNGDLNLDGAVDGDAATIFSTFYDNGATSGDTYAEGDLNGDGKIDGNDATIFSTVYGNGLTSSGLPQL